MIQAIQLVPARFTFVCLDPRKNKRTAIYRSISPLGSITWVKLAPVRFKGYPESAVCADVALKAAKKIPKSSLMRAAKHILFRLQYNGVRSYFERHKGYIAVVWNGLNGTRRVFMDGARDAGAKTLFFELGPFADTLTVDPCGVNNANSLPRDPEPYLLWAAARRGGNEEWRLIRDTIKARQPITLQEESVSGRSLDEPFIFVPLQVPGDSQLRIFGGAFRTVESVIKAVAQAAKSLPDGWHLRLKEHPTSPVRFDALVTKYKHPKLVLDNATDTFTQVGASQAVLTVNSSVGLEAMFFEKPVVAMGECFWAIPGVAEHCGDLGALEEMMKMPAKLTFDPVLRNAFLSFLIDVYYPKVSGEGWDIATEEIEKIRQRLNGPDVFGFWSAQSRVTSQ